MPGYNLSGKVFLITGGATGIGLGLVQAVLSKHAKVFFIDLDEKKGRERREELASNFGSENVAFAPCNVTDRQRFEECFQEAVATFGHVDVMINNVGVVSERAPKVSVDVNFLATIYGTEIAAAHMRKDSGGKGGRVVNVSSFTGLHAVPNLPVYCATKHAVRAYTQAMAKHPQVKELGVEYAVLLPDAVDTEGYHFLPDRWLFGPSREEYKKLSLPRLMSMEEFTKKVLDCLQLENINDQMMMVTKTQNCFVKLEPENLDNIPPASV